MRTMVTRQGSRAPMLVAAAVVGPFAVMSLYLFFSRWPTRWFTGSSDYVAIPVSALLAAALIWLVPLRPLVRIAVALVAATLLWGLLFLYSFYFVGAVFGDWL